MIDLRLLRDNPDIVRASQVTRGDDPALVDAALDADARHRAALSEFESLRAEQKSLGKQVAQAQGAEKQGVLARATQLAAGVGGRRAGAAAPAPPGRGGPGSRTLRPAAGASSTGRRAPRRAAPR